MKETWRKWPHCGERIWLGCCRDPRSLSTHSGTGLVTLEAVGIATATGIEETMTLSSVGVEMPLELTTLADTVIGRHVASLFGGHFCANFIIKLCMVDFLMIVMCACVLCFRYYNIIIKQ